MDWNRSIDIRIQRYWLRYGVIFLASYVLIILLAILFFAFISIGDYYVGGISGVPMGSYDASYQFYGQKYLIPTVILATPLRIAFVIFLGVLIFALGVKVGKKVGQIKESPY